jgi:hypothetical protein
MKLSEFIFWDTDYSGIDWEKKAQYVIARVVMFGTVNDWKEIKAYYGLQRIKETMIQERDIDERSLSFLSCILDIPKEKFRCYKVKQSRPPHLNF